MSRMEANVFLDLWRIAPSEDMAAQTIARMEKEDPGQMMCISLLEEVRKSGSIVRRLHNAIHRINRYPVSGKVLIVIYPVDSVIYLSNNLGQVFKMLK